MMTFAEATGQPVIRAGRNEKFACPFHSDDKDGKGPSHWSCVGYPDGRFYCFVCQKWGSMLDLIAQRELGRTSHGKKLVRKDINGKVEILDQELLDIYTHYRPMILGMSASSHQHTRPFNTLEKAFLNEVRLFMHEELQRDTQAQRYLRGRGCNHTRNFFGVARPWHMPIIHEIADAMGDKTLPATTGIESTHEKWIGHMNYFLMDSVVIFQVDGDSVSYYQARTLKKSREIPYYNPKGITKKPIRVGEGPLLVAEGCFKTAWAVEYGFSSIGMTGKAMDHLPDSFFASLHGALYPADNDLPDADGIRQGEEAAKIMARRVAYSGANNFIHILMTPDPYVGLDDWAKGIGYANAARILHTQTNAVQGKSLLDLV